MLKESFNTNTILLLDCSANIMRIVAFKNGELIYLKDAEIGGNELSKNIAANLGIENFAEIEKMKIEKTEKTNNETYKLIEKNFLINYASEFYRTCNFFTQMTTISKVDEIILTGGVANMEGIEEYFRQVIVENKAEYIFPNPQVARVSKLLMKSNKISLTKLNRDDAGLFLVSSLAIRQFIRQY